MLNAAGAAGLCGRRRDAASSGTLICTDTCILKHWQHLLHCDALLTSCCCCCRLGHLLREVLRPKAVLALTATATLPTQRCICSVLGIGAGGVVRDAPLRANLRLHVVHMNGGSAGGAIRSQVLHMLTKGGWHAPGCRRWYSHLVALFVGIALGKVSVAQAGHWVRQGIVSQCIRS